MQHFVKLALQNQVKKYDIKLSYENKRKALHVTGLYPLGFAIATIMVQLGNKLPGIEKEHAEQNRKSISFSDIQQHREKHGVGC